MNRSILSVVASTFVAAAASIASAQTVGLVEYEHNDVRVTRTTPTSRVGFWDGKLRIVGTFRADYVLVYEEEVEPSNKEEYESELLRIASGGDFTSRSDTGIVDSRLQSPPVIDVVVECRNLDGELVYTTRESKSEISQIIINTGAGDDTIDIQSDIPCWINSGKGFDFVYGGEGDDYIENPRGRGKSYGRGGNDILVGNTTGGGYFGTAVDLFGGEGVDTYIMNFLDWIEDEMNGLDYSFGGTVTPMDFTYHVGRFAGMSQVTLDQLFFDEYGY